MLSVELLLLLVSEADFSLFEEFDVLDSRSVKRLWAVVVSPDWSAVFSVSNALDSGLAVEELLVEPDGCGGGFAVRYFFSEVSELSAVEVSPEERALWIDLR